MEEPHATSLAKIAAAGLAEPLHSISPLLHAPVEEQAAAMGAAGATIRAEPMPAEEVAHEQPPSFEVKTEKDEPLSGTALSPAPGRGPSAVVITDLVPEPALQNGEDRINTTSQGIAELDLDPFLENAFSQIDGSTEWHHDILPPLPGASASSPIFDPTIDPLRPAREGPPKIRAFAKIEFEDGQYYINTYAVELGRDVRAAKRAQQRRFQREVARRDRRRRGSDSSDDLNRHTHRRYAPSSAVSESGGIVNFESFDRRPRKKSKSKKSTSPSSSSFSRSRNNSLVEPAVPFDYQALAYEQLLRSGAAISDDPAAYVPSPHDVPLIPVHPPNNEELPGAGYGGISRRHARIAYNFDSNCFEFETLGKNGGFVDEIWLGAGEIAILDHGSKIQIGGVTMVFLLPNRGHTGTENTAASEVVSAMSFEFEDGRGDSIPIVDSSGSISSEELPVDEGSGSDDDDDDEGNIASDEGSDDIEESIENDADGSSPAVARKIKGVKLHGRKKAPKIKLKLKARKHAQEASDENSTKAKVKADQPTEPKGPKPEQSTLEDIANKLGVSVEELPARRKGPGRPPKDGVMSKREYANLVRQQKERQKAEGLQNGFFKPAKGINGLGAPGTPEKRKYTKRKKLEDGEDLNGVQESIEGGEDADDPSNSAPKPIKEKRPQKPPRSPSPVFDEAALTPEQLAKPTQSYVVLIHEALSNSTTGQMSLPQIYRAIERRYPYYKLKVQTQGWQSSVRHNLSQHAAFRKIEKDGKGWMWGLVPEVSIEKEKKRRPSPPPAPQQNFYPAGSSQQYRSGQFAYAPNATPSTPSQTPGQISYPYQPPAPSYSATIPDVARTYGNSLIPGKSMAPSTYQSPYTPAPSAPVQAQSTPYAENVAAAHNHIMASPYYANPAPSGLASNATPTAPPSFASPYPPALSSSKVFTTTQPGVPQAMLDACTNFKTKLMEHVDNTPEIVQAIDRALTSTLKSVMNGETSPPATNDAIEKIFIKEAYPALRGIWTSAKQSAGPQAAAQHAPAVKATTATFQPAASATETTLVQGSEAPTAEAAGQGSTRTPPATEGAKPAAAPLEQHQQTTILNLLQQLGQSAETPAEHQEGQGVAAANLPARADAPAAPIQRSQAMTASREAAEKAISALNVSTKRGHEDGLEERLDGRDEAGEEHERPPKRMAV